MKRAGHISCIASLLVVLCVDLAMLGWTWRRCPDPVIDFGRELYLPWRISAGQVLYRDLNHFNGPLSPYFNAMLFEVSGVSLRTLKVANAAIIILMSLLIWRMALEIGDMWGATAAGVVFAVVFACGQLGYDASFNFLTPYSHDLTHGVALSLAMIACLWRASRSNTLLWVALSGFTLGIILLTKAELALAALIGALGGMIPLLMSPTRSRLRLVAVFAGMMLIPPVMALLLLWCAMPFSDALAGMAGSWRWIGDPRLTRISYFRFLLGIDNPAGNVRTILTWSGAYAAFLAAAVLAGRLARGKSNRTVALVSIAIGFFFGAILWWFWPRIVWSQAGRPLPLAIGIIIVVLLIKLRRSEDRSRLVLPLAWSCFAGALLAKMLLKTNMYHYGFALAMPAAMLVLSVIVGTIPRRTADYGRGAWAARAGVLVLLGTFLATVIHTNHRWLATRVHPVGYGHDAFLADERGAVMNRMLDTIARLSTAGDTLVAIPEGPMLNYLARRVNPTRYQNFLPAEMMLFGEQNMLRELESTRPGFVAMVHANTTTYDATWFGEHYGLQIDAWIKANYLPVAQEGAIPFTSDAFGILLTQRKH